MHDFTASAASLDHATATLGAVTMWVPAVTTTGGVLKPRCSRDASGPCRQMLCTR